MPNQGPHELDPDAGNGRHDERANDGPAQSSQGRVPILMGIRTVAELWRVCCMTWIKALTSPFPSDNAVAHGVVGRDRDTVDGIGAFVLHEGGH